MAPIRVHFDGKVFVPDEPVDLPAGTPADTYVAPAKSSLNEGPDRVLTPLQRLVERLAECPDDPDAPTDGAAQHDHYLYGHPKRP